MSLFPAYAQDSSGNKSENEGEPCTESLELEAQLLASDNDEERESVAAEASTSSASHDLGLTEQQNYYLDCKLDVGNLRVSTLYYPGRPQYTSMAPREALGGAAPGPAPPSRARRYYAAPAPPPDAQAAAELAQRTRAFRDLLAENPTDEALWLRFIEFQERSRDADAALSAASEAAARMRGSRCVRAALHRARDQALLPQARLDLLRRDLAAVAEAGGGAGAGDELTELWLRVLAAVCASGTASELDAAAGAALAATRAHPLAYPHILYVYGGYLRAAGLWERLVLLLELVCSMNFPPAAFPPHVLPERLEEQERQLQQFEDKVTSSGLPLSTMWVRVERARAAAHWRPHAAGPYAGPHADPQRAPLPADVAELLQPAAAGPAAALLLVNALRLAKVPLLPSSGYALAPTDATNEALGDVCEAEGGEGLLALLRAARRLPPAHPARPAPAPAARLVARFLEPPHGLQEDDAGFRAWLAALWDAACGWLAGEPRVALLCWRLRWLHALVLLHDPQDESGRKEARRLRGEARAALKRFAGTSPLPFAQFARIEHAAGDRAAARRAALHALRAALRGPALAPHARLYVARVAGEVCEDAALGAWATVSAALELALPPDEQLGVPPPVELQQRALQACEEQCAQLELQREARPAHVLDALLPAPAEWAAARAQLAGPARRAQLLACVRAALPCAAGQARYWEQSACALALAAAREHRLAQLARALAPHFPHCGLLALACSGAPLWAWAADGTAEERLRALAGGARSHRAALAHVLPPLLRADAQAWAPGAAARVRGACARAGRMGAGGPLLLAVRLESEARAAHPRPAAALYAALDRYPQHKWLAVRGAACCPEQTPALADVLLERQLRAHTLLDELSPSPLAS